MRQFPVILFYCKVMVSVFLNNDNLINQICIAKKNNDFFLVLIKSTTTKKHYILQGDQPISLFINFFYIHLYHEYQLEQRTCE